MTLTSDGAGSVVSSARRPSLSPGLCPVAIDNHLVVLGGGAPVVFSGKGTTNVLGPLLDILDGNHSAVALGERLGLPVETAQLLIDTLDARSLLSDTPPQPRLANVQMFLNRCRAGRGPQSSRAVDDALRQARVIVIGENQFADTIRGAIRATINATESHPATSHLDLPTSLVIAACMNDDLSALEWRTDFASVPVLVCRLLSTDVIEVGPILIPGFSACVRCVKAAYDLLPPPRPGAIQESGIIEAAASLVAMRALHHLTQTNTAPVGTSPHAPLLMHRIDLTEWRREVHQFPRLRRCPRCDSAAQTISRPPRLVEAYERLVEGLPELPTAEESSPSAHARLSAHVGPARRSVASAGPFLSIDETLGNRSPIRADTDTPLAAVAALARHTAGFRSIRADPDGTEWPRRWAPSGGNLGGVSLYFLIPGWNGGSTLAFDPWRDGLAHLARDVDEQIRACVSSGEGTVATGVLVADLARVGNKYGPFSYRLTHLEAGCLLAQSTFLAPQFGLNVRTNGAHNTSALTALLCLSEDEIVTATFSVVRQDTS